MSTRIISDIDYDRPGKQVGVVRIPHSDNNFPYGFVPVPIAVIARGVGPTVLLTGGTHGDEYEGQVILRRMIHELDPGELNGRVIILPAINYLAAQAGRRCWPGDNLNMNRVYPGDPDVTPTPALAHYVESVILPRCDFGVDLHSGGRVAEFLPCVYLRKTDDAELMARKLAATEAFAAPLVVTVAKTSDNRSLIAAGDRSGVPMIATELRGMGSVSLDGLEIGREGVYRVLRHLGVLPEDATHEERPRSRFVEYRDHSAFVYSHVDGLFEPFVALGDTVEAGQPAGCVHSHQDASRPATELQFGCGGLVVSRRVPARVGCGDYVFSVASDVATVA